MSVMTVMSVMSVISGLSVMTVMSVNTEMSVIFGKYLLDNNSDLITSALIFPVLSLHYLISKQSKEAAASHWWWFVVFKPPTELNPQLSLNFIVNRYYSGELNFIQQ